MDSLPSTNKSPVGPLIVRGISQTGIPVNGYADLTTISQADVKFAICKPNVGGEDGFLFSG